MKGKQNFAIVNVNNNQLPIITEDTRTRYTWIPFGVYGQDDFFDAMIAAYNVSTTNAASVEGIADLIFGKGVYSKNEAFNETLQKLIPQEDLKRVTFDLKLFVNAAIQVYWDDTHTKIKKMLHLKKDDGDYLILKKWLKFNEDTGRITHTNIPTKEQKNSIK